MNWKVAAFVIVCTVVGSLAAIWASNNVAQIRSAVGPQLKAA
jgi:hypothetical protein